jgi:hypothetical protein
MTVRIEADNGEFLVETNEIPGGKDVRAIYRFSKGLEPLDVTFDDSWAARHRQLEAESKLDHGIADCPHLNLPTSVRRWEPNSGWTTLMVPPSGGLRPDAYRR